MSHKHWRVILFWLGSFSSFAQINFNDADILFSKGYFVLPVQPGKIASLSGCFGDLRPNHFHAGWDIRTGGVEGVPIQAAAEGYISRIKIARDGYGNAVYVTHPNKLTTVYAHLRELAGPWKMKLLAEQYRQNEWELDLTFPPGQFPVKQKEILGYSGNTGSSAGPHLHFEIRDAEERILDPALFGFKEVQDKLPPQIHKITLRCLSHDARINGNFGAFDFVPVQKNGVFQIPSAIRVVGKVGVEVLTFDRAETTPFKLGIQSLVLLQNQQEIFSFRLRRSRFDQKLDMNLHTDYERMYKTGERVHRLYVMPGNRMDKYRTGAGRGTLTILDRALHEMALEVGDSYGQTARMLFTIQGDAANAQLTSNQPVLAGFPTVSVKQDHRFLIIQAKGTQASTRQAYVEVRGKWIPIGQPIKTSEGMKFIHDLAEGIPTQVMVEKTMQPVPTIFAFHSGRKILRSAQFVVNMQEALYDTAYLHLAAQGNRLMIHSDIIPLKDYFQVQWEAPKVGTVPLNRQHVYFDGARRKFLGGEWTDQGISFQSKELGVFSVRADTVAPRVQPIRLSTNELRFKISDNLSGIRDFHCWVNENWILMKYEYKNGQIWSEKLDNSVIFQGQVRCRVTDRAGNEQIFQSKIP